MQRVCWIDNLKAFAIFIVVAGHMMSCDAFFSEIGQTVYEEFILAFHMPLFAVLSGWFLKYKMDVSFGSQLLKKIRSILFPYLIWCFLWFFIKPIIETVLAGNAFHFSSLIWQFKFFLDDGLCCYGWWFLRALFFCFLYAYISIWICKGRMLFAGIGSCLLLYILSLTGIIPNMQEKDSLLKGFVFLYPFLWTGYAFHYFEKFFDNNKSWLLPCFAFVFVIFLYFWQGADSFYSMNTSALEKSGITGVFLIEKTLWRYSVGIVTSLFFIILFKSYLNNEFSFLSSVGQNTLGIYILQSLVYWTLPHSPLLSHCSAISMFIISLMVSAVIMLGFIFIINITSKNDIIASFLWGKLRK